MKKQYVKPLIIIENFSLNTDIAGDCEEIVGNPTKGTCAIESTGGVTYFDGKVGSACDYMESDDKYDEFCYHVPTEDKNLFNS